jgi:hypothetical protein
MKLFAFVISILVQTILDEVVLNSLTYFVAFYFCKSRLDKELYRQSVVKAEFFSSVSSSL